METTEYLDAATGAALSPPRTTRHVFDGIQTIQEYCVVGQDCPTLLREFVWGDANRFPEPLAMIDHSAAGFVAGSTPEVLHYLRDVLGSVIGLTDSNGNLVERYTYDPYGRPLIEWLVDLPEGVPWAATSASFYGNPFLWTGQRYDAAAGTYHYKRRTYSISLGRWAQRDEMGFIDGVNLFAYARLNPVTWVDPTGRSCIRAAEAQTTKDVGDLKVEGYIPESNDWKILHCINACNFQKQCFQDPFRNLPRSLQRFKEDIRSVGGWICTIGGACYEAQTACGVKLRIGETYDKPGKRYGPFVKYEKFDGQHPLMFAIDSIGDIVANTLGLAIAMADGNCKDGCRAAHSIWGPNYSKKAGGGDEGGIVPIGPGQIIPPQPPNSAPKPQVP